MKIALVGYGRMGRAVEQVARAAGHEVVARIDPAAEDADGHDISAEAVGDADVCVEFTLPGAAVGNFRQLLELGRPVVTGTTGWFDRVDEVRQAVEAARGSFLYAPNFSLGVNLFYRITAAAAGLMDRFAEYDPYIYEIHHSGKADSPSGTALRLADVVKGEIARKTRLALGNLDRRIEPDELHVVAARAGGVPGTHTVGFEGAFDSITLTHANRGRESLAKGAVLAAEWLQGRQGFFEFGEVIDAMLQD